MDAQSLLFQALRSKNLKPHIRHLDSVRRVDVSALGPFLTVSNIKLIVEVAEKQPRLLPHKDYLNELGYKLYCVSAAAVQHNIDDVVRNIYELARGVDFEKIEELVRQQKNLSEIAVAVGLKTRQPLYEAIRQIYGSYTELLKRLETRRTYKYTPEGLERIQKAARERHAGRKTRKPQLIQAQKDELEKFARAGYCYKEIMAATGLNGRSSVRHRLNKYFGCGLETLRDRLTSQPEVETPVSALAVSLES